MSVHIKAMPGGLTARGGLGARSGLRALIEARPASPEQLRRQAQARTAVRYQLRDRAGAYVNIDLSGKTSDRTYAWTGLAHHLDAVRRRRPDLSDFLTVAVMPERRPGVVP